VARALGRLWARGLAFAGCLEFFAFTCSFGTIRHVHHLLVITTFLLLFLPAAPAGRGEPVLEGKTAYLRAFWGAQCGLLLTYSMSGFMKILIGLWQLATTRSGVLTPSALALHAANSAFRFGIDPPGADVAIRAGPLGLPLYLAVIYVETASLSIAFRPSLHRVWGAALILLHLGIGLVLNLFFTSSILVVGILLLASPFAPPWTGWRRAARDLPIAGRLFPRGSC